MPNKTSSVLPVVASSLARWQRLLRRESPLALSRELLWRTRRRWNARGFAERIQQPLQVRLRHLDYFRGVKALHGPGLRGPWVAAAERILLGEFPFLGYGPRQLGFPPPWHQDFVSGTEWPLAASETVLTVRGDGSDVKVPWELSRLQVLPVLGRAHVLSGDERFRAAGMELISDWTRRNPVGQGVNWTIAMEAAIRALNIGFFLELARPPDAHWQRMCERLLWEHLLFIETHSEFSHLVTSNHYLSNLVGSYGLSLWLEGPGMVRRRRLCRTLIELEMRRQVYDDGGDYEASTGYHCLVSQMFTTAWLLMRAEGVEPAEEFVSRLRRMFLWMDRLADFRGELPHLGDCDDGRVELLADDLQQVLTLPVAARSSLRIPGLLGIGRALFGVGCGGHAEDACWHVPRRHGNCAAVPRPARSLAVLPNSGIGLARYGDAEVFLLAIPNGIGGKGSHTHNDKLSVLLRLHGEELLADSGTATYTRDEAMRNRFRSTRAHNTVMVDGEEQNGIRPGLPFRLDAHARVSALESREEAGVLALRAGHTGYERIGISHWRTVELRPDRLLILDEIQGKGVHRFELNYHLGTAWRAESCALHGGEAAWTLAGVHRVSVGVSAPVEWEGHDEEILLSRTYGSTITSRKLVLRAKARAPLQVRTEVKWEQ